MSDTILIDTSGHRLTTDDLVVRAREAGRSEADIVRLLAEYSCLETMLNTFVAQRNAHD